MVIKSNTLSELRKNASYSRQYAAALIAHAERIEALIEAEAAVADLGASQTPAEPVPAPAEAPAENSLAEPLLVEPPRVEPEPELAQEEAPAEVPQVNAPAAPFTRLELPRPNLSRPNREAGVTQVEAIQTVLRGLGRPASLGEIFTAIKSQRIPVKLTSAENLRFVMRGNDDFESNEAGQWQLKTTQPAPDYTDRASALTAPEGVEVAS